MFLYSIIYLKSVFKYLCIYYIYLFVCMCKHVWVHVYIPWCMCRGKKTTHKCKTSPSTMQVSDIKLSSSDLATITLTGSAIQPAFLSLLFY